MDNYSEILFDIHNNLNIKDIILKRRLDYSLKKENSIR